MFTRKLAFPTERLNFFQTENPVEAPSAIATMIISDDQLKRKREKI
jgi:hypothetical protein